MSDGMNPGEWRYKQMILFTKNVSPVTLKECYTNPIELNSALLLTTLSLQNYLT